MSPPTSTNSRSFDHLVGAQISIRVLAKSANNVASHTLHKTLHQPLLARRADLLPDYLSQRLIDPVLPVRSGFLKVIKNVPVNLQRDKLLGIRDSRTLRREFHGLRGCRLKRRFSRIP
jgi:hypothetical protein